MCSRNDIPLSIRSCSYGSGSGKFSLGMSSPLAYNLNATDDIFRELFEFDLFNSDLNSESEDQEIDFESELISSSDEAISSSSSYEDLFKFTVPITISATTVNRRNAIVRWRAKRCRQKGVVKICRARSVVACSRPRVQGRFVRKVEFVPITELQN